MGIAENKQVVLDFYEAGARGDIGIAPTFGIAETTDGTPSDSSCWQVSRMRDGQVVAVKEHMDTALIDSVFGPA